MEIDSMTAAKPTADRAIAVNYEYSPSFVELLQRLNASIVLSTYQAGKVMLLGTQGAQLTISHLDYDRPMGVAVGRERIAIGAGAGIHFLQSNHEVAPTVQPRGSFDGCFIPHSMRYTGKILVHDLAWGSAGLWAVNTLFSCLCTLDDKHSFVPRWRPRFISQLADQDRCHLNGMAIEQGSPRYVTVLAESDRPAGWRDDKARTGCVIDVSSGDCVVRGLCMPHSPRVHHGQLFVLNSGLGQLSAVQRQSGEVIPLANLPGYTRGLSFYDSYAFVGLSRIRESNVFGGLPISQQRDELYCGIGVIDLRTQRTVATFRFASGVEEIFAVDVIPGFKNVVVGGATSAGQSHEVWVVPPPATETGDLLPLTAPRSVDAAIAVAAQAQREGRNADALEICQRALHRWPDAHELWSLCGHIQQDLGRPPSALECYQRSLRLKPDQPETLRNIGVLEYNHNRPEQALQAFAAAQQLRSEPLNQVLSANVMPIIYPAVAEVSRWRQRSEDLIDSLVANGQMIDTSNTVVPTSFYYAYQGYNDRRLMTQLGRIFRGPNCCDPANSHPWAPRQRQIRVGLVSAYFCQHTIGRLNLGLVQNLDRSTFELTVIALQKNRDRVADSFRQNAARYVETPRHVPTARKLIADLELDVLIFADVGMDCIAQALCYSRLAPIQAATWGHPETTGSPAIDYFLSTDLAEPAQAQEHYSERLIRQSTMGIYYEQPQLIGERGDKSLFGLPAERRVYLCPQTLFKFHPQMDPSLAEILRTDPSGDLVVIASGNDTWNVALQSRWQQAWPDLAGRIRFIPSQPRPRFLQLLAAADVVLDTFPFGGGNTSYEAIGIGAPVVTLPGEYLRGRLTQALYSRIGVDELVASSPEHYVQLALQVANDAGFAEKIRRKIRKTAPILFDNPDDIEAFSGAIKMMVARAGH